MSSSSTVLVDTDVFSFVYVRRPVRDPRVQGWIDFLRDRRVAISFQTRAEMLVGATTAGWGIQRTSELVRLLDTTPTIRASNGVVDAFARLTAECRRAGHALQDRLHVGDRWVAACAIAHQLELLAGDGIYRGAPDLTICD